ncbi:GMC family oxidoreductase [Candidatus Binatia bacterium]|nr:GMC family oxidoreductase [Candidatus Binatia bacterium]
MTTGAEHSYRIAAGFVEAAFPAGDRLPAPDVGALLTAAMSADAATRRRYVQGLLWWLELRYLATHGRSFSSASRAERSAFLRQLSGRPLAGTLLRLLALPFRAAYLTDAGNLERVGARDAVCPAVAVGAERWRARIVAAAELEPVQDIECDVAVIGTGAGGAAAAYELAGRGLAVVMIEEGDYHDRRTFNGKLTEMVPRLYRAAGATVAVGRGLIPLPIGRSVGGTTTINSGTCLRTPEATLADWRAEGLSDFTAAHMQPFFELVEEVLRVGPADPRDVGQIGPLIAAGAERVGLRDARPLLRNADGCDGQGVCQLGCPTDAKRSTNVSFVPRALESGAVLYTGLRAERLRRAGTAVTGLVATGRDARGGRVELRVGARATVVAAGTLLTPRFLHDNGVRTRWLGANLSIHPAGVVTAWFPDREFDHGQSIPQGFGVHDLQSEGLMFEGGTPPFAGHGLLSPFQAEDFVRFAERYRQTAYFGFMIKDTARGRVRRGLRRDLPLVTYSMNDRDFALFKRGIDLLARMYFAAGAHEVAMPGPAGSTVVRNEAELEGFWRSEPGSWRFLISAYHPLGTARIAATPERGVCDPEHRVWNVDGLYVMDGASVPSSLGANPQVTIMAMATRAARLLAARLAL